MKADTLTLTQLFNHPICFVVPLYQRRYVWKKDQQWAPLWEDVRFTTEAFLRESASLAPGDLGQAEERTSPHFLGAVVVEQVPGATGMIDVRNVIDGQQRLMTLQLLLDAAHDVAEEVGYERARLFGMLTENDSDLVREKSDHYKVWPSKYDQDAFQLTMNGNVSSDADGFDPAGSSLWQAHEYFCDEIRDWLSTDDRTRDELFDALRTTLWRLLRVVVIDLERNDNAQIIFETLNARGTPLLASDLIRNTVFRQAAHEGLAIDPLYERYWKQLDSEWWREEVVQGRLKRPRLDVFFFHWLTMTLDEEIGVHDVFPRFNRYSELKTPDALLEDIALHAKTYSSFDTYEQATVEGRFFKRLEAMETSTATPLLLFVLAHDDDTISRDQKHGLMRAIESWLVRRMMCRLTTKNYNQVFLALQSAVRSDPTNAGDVTAAFLGNLSGESQLWPSDDDVVSSLLTLPIYRSVSRSRIRMLLEGIENQLRSGMAEEATIGGRVSIEHILPQAWETNWPLPEGVDPRDAGPRRDLLKHTLGNLTLVHGKLNSTLSNEQWSRKHATLRQHITLFLNKNVVNDYEAAWDEEAILARGRTLSNVALEIWPGPEPSTGPVSALGSDEAREFMLRHSEDLSASGADVAADEDEARDTLSHEEIAATVKTEFLRGVLGTLEAWLESHNITVRHMKGTHHSLYVGKRWLGGYYFASKWLHVWLSERSPVDEVLLALSDRRGPSFKERSVVCNVATEGDLDLVKKAILGRIDEH